MVCALYYLEIILIIASRSEITVLAHEPLRVSLEDLHSADINGKWWLVGAAWGGDPLVDRQNAIEGSQKTADHNTQNSLVKLARRQGMNTDVRRSIFVVLVSSEVSHTVL